MSGDLVDPLTPADCDLRDFPFMPLDVARLRGSALAAVETREACWSATMLWAKSWHEVPAASLSPDDGELAAAAGFGRDLKGWRRVKAGALRGFVLATDGRLYHPVVAVKALEAWLEKLAQRVSGGEGNAKRWGVAFDRAAIIAAAAQAAAMLRALDPKSNSFRKKFVMGLPAGVAGGSGGGPGGSPGGNGGGIPTGPRRDIPVGSQGTGKGREGKDIPSPSSEPEAVRAREKSARAEMAERIARDIGVGALGELPPSLCGSLMAEVESLVAQGCDYALDIAPALGRRPDGQMPRTPAYWASVARGNRDRRRSGPAQGSAGGSGPRPVVYLADAEVRLASWFERQAWISEWGPRPGEAGCWIADEVIVAFRARRAA